MKTKAAALSAVLLIPACAFSESNFEEILVLGTKLEETLPQELEKYGNRLEVVTAEQIQQGGFNDAAQAMQMLVPGLYMAPKNGAFDYVDISLQGSRRNEVLVLIDGVRISNRLYNTTTTLDTIPAHMIERIEVLKGGQGILYGTQSVAGVINIVTKGFSASTDGGVGLGFDTNDGRHASAYLRGKLGQTSLVGYASYDEADGFEPYRSADFQPSAIKRDRGYDVKTFGAKAGQEFGESIVTTLQYQYSDATADFASPQRIRERYNERQEHIFSGKFDVAVNERFDLFVKAYYHEWTTHYTQIDAATTSPFAPISISDAEFWGFQDLGVNLLGQFKIAAGVDLLGGFDRQQFNGSDEVLLIADKTEKVNAFFMQLRTGPELIERTHFAAGFRYNDAQDGAQATVWSASGQVDVSDSLYARATVGTSFRLPDAYELFAIDPFDILGNPLLKPETSTNYELGIGGKAVDSPISWEVMGFKRKVEDLISDDGTTAINSEAELDVSGFEAVASVVFNDSWRASVDFTHTKAEFDGANVQAQRIPKDTGKLGVDYTSSGGRFGVGLSSAYVGDVNQTVSGVGVVEFGNYWVADITSYFFVDADRHHRLGVRVENALDEEYATTVMRGVRDVGGTSYRVDNRGTPRTFHLNYDYRFGR